MSELNNFDLYNNPELRKLDNPETKKDDDDDDDSPERLSKRQPEKKDKTKDDKEQAPKEKPGLKHLKSPNRPMKRKLRSKILARPKGRKSSKSWLRPSARK